METIQTKTRFEARWKTTDDIEGPYEVILNDNTNEPIEGDNVPEVLEKLVDLFDCSGESEEFKDVIKRAYIAEISVKSVAELNNFDDYFFACKNCDQVHQFGTLYCGACGEDLGGPDD